jgi:Protein of unknown function (DUF3071)
MQENDLRLVGVSEDKLTLVLANAAGEEFTLPADARLRAALRGEHTRPGQLENTMESALRPRDIQARIRAGESPEEVAASAQTTIEKIMGYATPVLAERVHVTDRAQRASVRRKGSDGPSRVLGDAVTDRLRSHHVDPATVQWDAWRRDDGRWTVVADYPSDETAGHAQFVFDPPGRYVLAEDDEARWLVAEPSTSAAPARATGPRRLSAVDNDDAELPLGEDAIGMVSEDAGEAALMEEPTAGLSAVGAVGAAGDADWIATQATDRPARAELGSEADESGVSVDASADAGEISDTGDIDDAVAGEAPGRTRRTAKRNRRASVPSWDEIMFGGGKQE